MIYRVPPNFPGAGRRVYPGFMQYTGFVAMNPNRHVTSHYDYFQDLIRGDDESTDSHRQFYDEYNAVLDMPAEYYLDTIKTVFQDFSLVNGTWVVNGTLVQPQDITTSALLTIEGELDDISGAGQTKAAHGLCTGIPSSRLFHYDVEGAGHYGIFSGRRWREKVYPQVKAFIERFNQDGAKLDLDRPGSKGQTRLAAAVVADVVADVVTAVVPVVVADVSNKTPARVAAMPAVKLAAKQSAKPSAKPAEKPASKPAAKAQPKARPKAIARTPKLDVAVKPRSTSRARKG